MALAYRKKGKKYRSIPNIYTAAYLLKHNTCCEMEIVEEMSGCGKGDLKLRT